MSKLIIIAGVLGTAFSAIFVRFSTAPSMILVLYRVCIAALFLTPAVIKNHRGELAALTRRQWLLSALSGLFLGLHFTAYFEALQYTSIASAVLLVDTEVFFVAAGAYLFAGETLSKNGLIGIGITFAGSAVVAFGDAGGGNHVIVGNVLALAGAVFMAIYTVIGKINRKSMSTSVYTWIVYISAGVTVLLGAVFAGIPLTGYGGGNILLGFLLALVCTLGGHSVFSWGLKYVKASFISTAKLLEPVFASILGWIFFMEVPGAFVAAGGFLVILGIAYFERHLKGGNNV